jgi:hypothetical protein
MFQHCFSWLVRLNFKFKKSLNVSMEEKKNDIAMFVIFKKRKRKRKEYMQYGIIKILTMPIAS